MGPCSVFVYYKVEAAQAAVMRDRVNLMHRTLIQKHPALQTQLLLRVDAHPHQTWMEVYQHPQGVDESMQNDIEKAALAMKAETCGQLGERHTEVFAPCV